MKFTCIHCCSIFYDQQRCPICGSSDVKPIIVEVQNATETIVIPAKRDCL
ncbi:MULTISPECIES: hypothetical protein [Brevibacillus]|uniref:Uncharacterized protein n=1 Tax=Brevibacillus laterosporus LMG 15441 TaxID=1042163 RepID=A0A075R7N3_BRELA|nr:MULTISPECIES: hypothetical protein [Brevibacillus]AIG27879.1 hypothetical protein BRLA_c035670 [Brevibacillus laterosporus LMG 15441]MBA4533534.1 hypothetical protein [Brevibacillus halotolerans]WPS86824.1 hypothetical protein SMD22_20290 [Brevibacillus halotolerans]CCF16677.1 hypothetical protein BLGI_4646 [Brevibacillus laterosporus GI-9]